MIAYSMDAKMEASYAQPEPLQLTIRDLQLRLHAHGAMSVAVSYPSILHQV